jgi:hypothetical protein
VGSTPWQPSYDVTTYKYANGTFAAVATRNVPASELPKG